MLLPRSKVKQFYNSYGYHTLPWTDRIDGGQFKDAFVDMVKSLGHCHVSAVMMLDTFLHGFDGYSWNEEEKKGE